MAVRVLIAGDADPANPTSIPPEEIETWRAQPGLEFLGHVADIRQVWAQAHIAVLPSRREGLPKSLLEAAACGRPIVATDVPGCREIARPGVNALLVPRDDAPTLAAAIERLASDPDLRARFGSAGRRLVEENFSSERIGRASSRSTIICCASRSPPDRAPIPYCGPPRPRNKQLARGITKDRLARPTRVCHRMSWKSRDETVT